MKKFNITKEKRTEIAKKIADLKATWQREKNKAAANRSMTRAGLQILVGAGTAMVPGGAAFAPLTMQATGAVFDAFGG